MTDMNGQDTEASNFGAHGQLVISRSTLLTIPLKRTTQAAFYVEKLETFVLLRPGVR